MKYIIGRAFIRFILRCFFAEIEFKGEPIVKNGPVILVGNHPNMMVDPLLLIFLSPRPLWFLGKATLFKNPIIASILRGLYLLPLYRQMDKADTSKNVETFQAVTELLGQQKAICLFPEGTSVGGRKILSFKTGAARMALQAEKEFPEHKVVIQPVGITYSDPGAFRSRVAVVGGVPIAISDYLSHSDDERQVVREITQELEERMKALVVQVKSEELDQLVTLLQRLFATRGEVLGQVRTIAEEVSRVAPYYPEEVQKVKERARLLLEIDAAPSQYPLSWWRFLLVSLGAALWGIPYALTRRIARRVDGVEQATVKISVGTLIFLLWTLVLILSLFIGTQSWEAFSGGAVLIILSSYSALTSYERWRITALQMLFPKEFGAVRALKELFVEELRSYQEAKSE